MRVTVVENEEVTDFVSSTNEESAALPKRVPDHQPQPTNPNIEESPTNDGGADETDNGRHS